MELKYTLKDTFKYLLRYRGNEQTGGDNNKNAAILNQISHLDVLGNTKKSKNNINSLLKNIIQNI